MALPTIPCAFTTRKNIYEQSIVRRRNHEDDFRIKWNNTADYFHKNNVEVTKQQMWSSDRVFQDSMDAYKTIHEKEDKAINLKRRRLKLGELLQKDRDQYEAELLGYSKDNYTRLEDMRDRADGLKSAREEKRKQVADEKLYEHWRQNNHDLKKEETGLESENLYPTSRNWHQLVRRTSRPKSLNPNPDIDLEAKQLNDHVIEGWGEQVDEQQEQLVSARREKKVYEDKLESQRLAAMELEKQKAKEKLLEERRFKKVLREQVAELHERETESEMLRHQQAELQKHQWELDALEEERRKMDADRKKQDLGRVLLRQHTAQMRRRIQQIQKELELDKQILESLIKKEDDSKTLLTARKEKARADASWMKSVIEEQIRVEKTREAELDMLFQEEAARVWQQREVEWEKERFARERLMKEVLQGRQNQIDDKMMDIQKQHEESIERREELLKEIELANQLTHREQKQDEQAKVDRKQELEQQMKARMELEDMVRLNLEEEIINEKKDEEDYEDLLHQEAQQMKVQGFTPRYHGRKQAWM